MEAYAMGVPAVAYRATVNEYYDNGLARIPNLSHQCFNFDELRTTLRMIFEGNLGLPDKDEKKALFGHYLAALDGPLACERIIDVLEKTLDGRSELPKPAFGDRLKGHYKTIRRNWKKQYKSLFPSEDNKPALLRHLYPGMSLKEVRTRISRFQQVLSESSNLRVDQIGKHIFRISG
jgi:hypothetical protein